MVGDQRLTALVVAMVGVSSAAIIHAAEPSGMREARTMQTLVPGQAVAVFAGGCFWCTEAVFEGLDGVTSVTSGYAGGTVPSPTFEQVSNGETGHAEVVRIDFDARRVTYQRLVELFFAAHDPTQLNRQGADVGDQYRSAIFYVDEAQRNTASEVRQRVAASGKFNRPLVTQIVPLTQFFPAEAYHQDYARRNPDAPYVRAVIAPKLLKFRQEKH